MYNVHIIQLKIRILYLHSGTEMQKHQFKDKTNYEFQRYQNTCKRTCVVTHHESSYNNAKQVRQTINTLNESIIDENITAVLSFS